MLLFNWFGYRLMTAYLENVSNAALEAQLDRGQYAPNDLISFRIPLTHLPYYNSGLEFERVNGEVEIDGMVYHFVKSRLLNDSLELFCIPNLRAMHLQTARDEFFKQVNDLQQTSQHKKAAEHPPVPKNYSADDYTMQDLFHLQVLLCACIQGTSHADTPVPIAFVQLIDNPPEARL